MEIEGSLIWIPARLPPGWRQLPATRGTAIFGDEWINSARSVGMRVPSAVVPGEWNYLLNPAHPDFSKLIIGGPLHSSLKLFLCVSVYHSPNFLKSRDIYFPSLISCIVHSSCLSPFYFYRHLSTYPPKHQYKPQVLELPF